MKESSQSGARLPDPDLPLMFGRSLLDSLEQPLRDCGVTRQPGRDRGVIVLPDSIFAHGAPDEVVVDIRQPAELLSKRLDLTSCSRSQHHRKRLELLDSLERDKPYVVYPVPFVEAQVILRVPQPHRADVQIATTFRPATLELDDDDPEALVGNPRPRLASAPTPKWTQSSLCCSSYQPSRLVRLRHGNAAEPPLCLRTVCPDGRRCAPRVSLSGRPPCAPGRGAGGSPRLRWFRPVPAPQGRRCGR